MQQVAPLHARVRVGAQRIAETVDTMLSVSASEMVAQCCKKTPASWLTGVSAFFYVLVTLSDQPPESCLVFASALAFGGQFKEPLGVGRQKLRIDNREARYAFQIIHNFARELASSVEGGGLASQYLSNGILDHSRLPEKLGGNPSTRGKSKSPPERRALLF